MLTKRDSLKLVGLDPSLRNWGIAVGWLELDDLSLTIESISTISPIISMGKQVRQNSKDVEAASQLFAHTMAAVTGAHAVFAEVPVGSQSSRAMASYGVCVGVLGSIHANGTPFYEVTPTEVKLAGPGIKTATKDQMINWAVMKHPEANWPKHKSGQVISSKAEHQADAIAAIYAGMASNTFKQLLAILKGE